MLIRESEAGQHVCPQKMPRDSSGGGCEGSRCMAWRPVTTQNGEVGYCGMAGCPPKVAAPLIGQTIETALAGLAPGAAESRILHG